MNSMSDHIMLINIMRFYLSIKQQKGKHAAKAFCLEHAINEKSMYKAVQIKGQLDEYLEQICKGQGSQRTEEITQSNCASDGSPQICQQYETERA